MAFYNDNWPMKIFLTSGESSAHTHKVTNHVSPHSPSAPIKNHSAANEILTNNVWYVRKSTQFEKGFNFIYSFDLLFVALVLITMYTIINKNTHKTR